MIRFKVILSFLTFLYFHSYTSIAQDANIEWANKVLEFSSQTEEKRFSALQILGKPNSMPQGGSNFSAWRPDYPEEKGKKKKQFIKVAYESPMYVKQISVFENYKSGSITKISLFDTKGKEYVVKKFDLSEKAGTHLVRNIVIEKTPYLVKSLKIYLDNLNIEGSQIDAVAIIDKEMIMSAQINLSKDLIFDKMPENLGKNINTKFPELLPVISADGKSLFFSRRDDPGNIINGADDIYQSNMLDDESWTEAQNIGPPINNKSFNSPITVSPDGNIMYVMNSYNLNGTMGEGLSFSKKTANGWSFPEKIKIDKFYNRNEYNEFSISNSGRILLSTLEREEGYGSKDIYVSFIKNDGTWTVPKNLGASVNTSSNESSPFLSSDEKTIYFSTPGLSGYGSNDIFVTRRLDESWYRWSEPENLGPMINSSDWEAYFQIPASGKYAYLVSHKNSIGREDIFRVNLPVALRPKPSLLVYGKVINAKTQMPLEAKIFYQLLPSGDITGNAISSLKTGDYKVILPIGEKYGLVAISSGFISVDANIDTQIFKEYSEVKRDLLMFPIEIGQTIPLNNIFFEIGSAEISPNSYPELDRLSQFLMANQEIKIKIKGHTDNLGTDEENLTLSSQRALSVSNYLQQKGILKENCSYQGYGASVPLFSNNSEENKKKNRRVEFEILKLK